MTYHHDGSWSDEAGRMFRNYQKSAECFSLLRNKGFRRLCHFVSGHTYDDDRCADTDTWHL